jgi:hypothetical protein
MASTEAGNDYHGDSHEILDLETLTTELAKPNSNIITVLSGALKSASDELDSRYRYCRRSSQSGR